MFVAMLPPGIYESALAQRSDWIDLLYALGQKYSKLDANLQAQA